MKVKRSKNSKQENKILELDNNIVRDYLKEHNTKKLSLNYLKKALNLKKSKVLYYCHHSNDIEKVKPHEVGSYRYSIDVFKYKE
uniref:Uncharacterized protein n=1 Tax=viral metagenome TaxID=1070528 RepID=A0A6C0KYP5_9ZZZZ|tara:strand:+ start:7300 stop:7551 length:252 start_codon:yes stop_codon:yes gene_type:complete